MAATPRLRRPSGNVYLRVRKRGPVWYAKYRLPSGRQVQRMLGPAWTGRGRPPTGHFTKRLADDWLRDGFERRAGAPCGGWCRPAPPSDAAAEFMRYAEEDRGCKPSTLVDYRSRINAYLFPAFGPMRLEDVSRSIVERWRDTLTAVTPGPAWPTSRRTTSWSFYTASSAGR